MKQLKPKKCKNCGDTFNPFNSLQKACSSPCALSLAVKQREKKEKKQLAVDRREFKLNDKATQRNLAQKYFNLYIRWRDKGQPCISCQRTNIKKENAGHYRTTAAAPQLRFNEENCNLQCEKCNSHLSGNIGEYRINLIKKIGQERVDWLEGHHEPKKYTVHDLVEIKLKYLKLCREMEAT